MASTLWASSPKARSGVYAVMAAYSYETVDEGPKIAVEGPYAIVRANTPHRAHAQVEADESIQRALCVDRWMEGRHVLIVPLESVLHTPEIARRGGWSFSLPASYRGFQGARLTWGWGV